MDKMDSVNRLKKRARSCKSNRTRLPRRCVPKNYRRQIQAADRLGFEEGALRYSQIRSGLLRGLEGTREIAPRVLSRELKALTESGLVDRKDYGLMPPKVEYRLTAKGRSFVPVVAAIRDWGARHLRDVPLPAGRIAAE